MDVGLIGEVARGLLPTIGVSLLFGIAILAIIRADAGERADRARIEAEEDAAAAEAARSRTAPEPVDGEIGDPGER